MKGRNKGYKKNVLWKKQKGLCGICNQEMVYSGATFDHVIPLAAGGANALTNLQLTHEVCNRDKGAGYTEPFVKNGKFAKIEDGWQYERKEMIKVESPVDGLTYNEVMGRECTKPECLCHPVMHLARELVLNPKFIWDISKFSLLENEEVLKKLDQHIVNLGLVKISDPSKPDENAPEDKNQEDPQQ